MKPRRRILLYLAASVWNVTVCWPTVLLIRLLWGENLRWEKNPRSTSGDGYSLWCDLKKDSWPERTWYEGWGGTALGHGGFYGYGDAEADGWTDTQEHEHIHVEQFEASMLRSLFVALVVFFVSLINGMPDMGAKLGFSLWWSGYLLMGASAWATAWLRGESAYRGSHHEESAYSQDDHRSSEIN